MKEGLGNEDRPVLMNEDEVEPIVLVVLGPQHLDASMLELLIESLVLDVADPVHGELGRALAKEDGRDDEPLLRPVGALLVGEKIRLAEVVD